MALSIICSLCILSGRVNCTSKFPLHLQDRVSKSTTTVYNVATLLHRPLHAETIFLLLHQRCLSKARQKGPSDTAIGRHNDSGPFVWIDITVLNIALFSFAYWTPPSTTPTYACHQQFFNISLKIA